ncbi:MAG: 2Fe-2S iron-sulfur cluster binding domain-containing protein [Oscillospiraceae bacterium]|nr:2Fe-2S iron-sulfur cluster binding domain-containing protein [Oscillospiraceae bacterium]
MSIKVEGFLKDVGGASRVVKLREESYAKASGIPDPHDPIREMADRLHPASMQVRVSEIRDASPSARTFRFEAVDGHIPVFQSGQYVNFRLKIGDSLLSRPYTISSAPYEARTDKPFFEVTIRRNVPYLVPDYFFENVRVGDVLEGTLPFGTFYWEPLRDTKEIVALAGGSGITPFHGMAKEIAWGKMKGVRLTILYGSVKANDIVLKEELDAIQADCPDVKVVHVLSDEPDWPGEKGFITREIIEKYSTPDTTFMFCGPLAMFRFVKKALDDMGVPVRRFRHDVVNNPADVSTLPGYPKGTETKTFKITVVRGIHEDVIDAAACEPVAVALERAAIAINTHCRNGECGFCRSQLLSGDIFVSPIGDGRRRLDKELGWFHACSSWPLSDLKIKIPIM